MDRHLMMSHPYRELGRGLRSEFIGKLLTDDDS